MILMREWWKYMILHFHHIGGHIRPRVFSSYLFAIILKYLDVNYIQHHRQENCIYKYM